MSSIDRKLLSKLVRREFEKACKDFTARIAATGFKRTQKHLWTRRHLFTADFIHFQRSGSSYGAPINAGIEICVHFGIRILNDGIGRPGLSGPYSDISSIRRGRYHLRFNAKSGHMYDRCIDDLVRFVNDEGLPWFRKYEHEKSILDQPDTPLRPETQEALRAAINGEGDQDKIAASLKLLGIKK